jgi:hypothetical protein
MKRKKIGKIIWREKGQKRVDQSRKQENQKKGRKTDKEIDRKKELTDRQKDRKT